MLRLAAVVLLLPSCVLFPDAPLAEDTLDGPIDGLTAAQLGQFVRGDEEFGRHFSFREGLGPLFNASSCASCHPGDGRAHPELGFTRFGMTDGSRFDPLLAFGGPQLQDRAAPGFQPERLPPMANVTSVFLAPAAAGLGLLEAVDDEVIIALADPDDLDGDGVSGRVSWVPASEGVRALAEASRAGDERHALEHPEGFVGRFGRRAGAVSLLHQTVNAYAQDMGVTSDASPRELIAAGLGTSASDAAPDPEASSDAVAAVVFYLRTLKPPAPRTTRAAEAGAAHFVDIGCGDCHTPSLTTGASTVAALRGVEVRAYTDLLLHDMGPELDDGYAEGTSGTAEWRTTPLWGLGLASLSQGGETYYMHDGRARTLREAIALHGGEGAASRAAFDALGAEHQEQLLRFLESL